MDKVLSEEELQDLFAWIDKIPLSRPKRHISRDFSDGVMAAEVVKYFFPKIVDLHNYVPANSTQQKIGNWELLNRKVFPKLDFNVPESTIKKIALNTAGAVVPVLSKLQEKIEKILEHKADNTMDMEYYDIRTHEKDQTGEVVKSAVAFKQDHPLTEARILAQLAEMRIEEKNRHKMSKHQQSLNVFSDMNPALKQIFKEKEQNIITLQETVEILQMKVSRLEHLVHLKDMRIEDLTGHLEVYRSKGKPH